MFGLEIILGYFRLVTGLWAELEVGWGRPEFFSHFEFFFSIFFPTVNDMT